MKSKRNEKQIRMNFNLFKIIDDLYFSIFICIILVLLSQSLSLLFLNEFKDILILLFFGQFIFLFLPTLFIIYSKKTEGEIVLPNSKKLNINDIIVIIIFLIISQISGTLIYFIFESILPENILEIINKFNDKNELEKLIDFNINNYFIVVLTVAVGPAIFEEFLFRGYLQNVLINKFSKYFAITFTSIIFAFLHFDIINLLGIFLLSCVIGYYKEKTNSLLVPICIHFLNNFISISLYNL